MTDLEGTAIRTSRRLQQDNSHYLRMRIGTTSRTLLHSLPQINLYDRQASVLFRTTKETTTDFRTTLSSLMTLITLACRSPNRFHNPFITSKESTMCITGKAIATIRHLTQLNLVQTISTLRISRAPIITTKLSNTSNNTYNNISLKRYEIQCNSLTSLGLSTVSGLLANRRYKDSIDPNEAQTKYW